MAIIDTLRFRNILVEGEVADGAKRREELVTALDESFAEVTAELATKSDIQQLRAEMAQIRAEILQAIAESDARNAQGRLTLFVGIVAVIGTATGLIIGFG